MLKDQFGVQISQTLPEMQETTHFIFSRIFSQHCDFLPEVMAVQSVSMSEMKDKGK